MNANRGNAIILLIVLLIMSYPTINTTDSSPKDEQAREEFQTIIARHPPTNYTEDWSQACSSVIVTGNATKDGRAILMKNRDLPDERVNIPIYVPAALGKYAYVGVNTNAMGINEKGLAVMNTYLPALAGSNPIEGNLLLNQMIMEYYESVSEVAQALNNSHSPIGPVHRVSLGNVATCVGVVDRFGDGAFFEISNTKAYVQHVVDGYDSRANHPRIFPGLSSGPSGRDQYLLDALDEVYNKYGFITPKHVMQNISRYVHHKELGSTNFSIDGEACNLNTVATMVAVSGDERYEGLLNSMWTACGMSPLVGLFVPSMVCAEIIPESIEDLWLHSLNKFRSARAQPITTEWLLYPERVRELQNYAFFTEDYTVEAYQHLMSTVPEGLADNQIRETIRTFVESMCNYASEIYLEETTNVEAPPIIEFATPTTSTSPTSTSTTTIGFTDPTSSPSETLYDDQLILLTIGAVSGFVLVIIAMVIKERLT